MSEEGRMSKVVHLCPPSAIGLTSCCGRSPFKLVMQGPAFFITLDPALVTCDETLSPNPKEEEG